jgi:hypothetical protein
MKLVYRKFLMVLALFWGGAFVVLAGTHMFLILPQQKESALLGTQLIEKKLTYDLSKAADSEQTRGLLARKVGELTGELNKFVVEVDELDSLWFSVSGIASEIGMESFQSRYIDDESYSVLPNCFDIGTASVEVQFSASFSKFARFINQLERYRPVIFVDEFLITRSRRENLAPEAKLVLSVFVMIPEEDKLDEQAPGAMPPAIEGV